jgi:hypothetical protein
MRKIDSVDIDPDDVERFASSELAVDDLVSRHKKAKTTVSVLTLVIFWNELLKCFWCAHLLLYDALRQSVVQTATDAVEPQLITINVQSLSGSLPPITMPAQATVRDLKLRLLTLNADFGLDRQKLMIFESRNNDSGAGVALLNHRSLQSYHNTSNTNVVLVMLPVPEIETSIDDALGNKDRFAALLGNRDLRVISIEVNSICKHKDWIFQLLVENLNVKSIKISGSWTEEHLQFCEALLTLWPDIDIRVVMCRCTNDLMLRVVTLCTSNRCSSIDLVSIILESSGCNLLVGALQSMSPLRTLVLNDNHIGAAGCASLATALQSMSSLQTLNLSYNTIGAAGCASLVPALQSMSTLQTLDLIRNQISTAGCIKLARALKSMTSLTSLNLFGNLINDAGCFKLARALQSMSSLQSLNLGCNGIGAAGHASLICAAKSMSSLRIDF